MKESLVNPKELFSFKRLDLIVKYLFAKDYLNIKNNDYLTNINKDLYIRTIIMRTMAVEPKNIYSNVIKTNTQDYISQFENLIDSIKNNGFNKKYKSGVMTALGIQDNSGDLDFIIKNKYRSKFGDEAVCM